MMFLGAILVASVLADSRCNAYLRWEEVSLQGADGELSVAALFDGLSIALGSGMFEDGLPEEQRKLYLFSLFFVQQKGAELGFSDFTGHSRS